VSTGETFAHYGWRVRLHDGPDVMTQQVDQFGAKVQFVADKPGIYDVHFDVGVSGLCADTDMMLNVAPPGAQKHPWRLRAVPPPTLAPPQEVDVLVIGGADQSITVALDPGSDVAGHIINSVGAAYLRFQPASAPATATEASSAAAGTFALRAGSGPYDVLIVPIASTKAPAHIGGWKSFQPNLTLPDGEPISGTVIGPDNAGVAGASVLLT